MREMVEILLIKIFNMYIFKAPSKQKCKKEKRKIYRYLYTHFISDTSSQTSTHWDTLQSSKGHCCMYVLFIFMV